MFFTLTVSNPDEFKGLRGLVCNATGDKHGEISFCLLLLGINSLGNTVNLGYRVLYCTMVAQTGKYCDVGMPSHLYYLIYVYHGHI